MKNVAKNVVMVTPEYFDVTYSINPWMNTSVAVNHVVARKQWESIVKELQSLGINVVLEPAIHNLNDMIFTANAGMLHQDKAIVSKFRDKERAGEEPYFKNLFTRLGYDTHTLPDSCIWEGQACSVFIDGYLVCSFSEGGRSNLEAYESITKIWNISKERQKYVKLIDPYFYHLDVCFCKINEDTAMLCPLAFSQEDNRWFQEHIPNIIQISYDEALDFCCNAFVFENHILISSAITTSLRESLEEHGLRVHPLDVSEYIKSGGGVKCLIFDI